MADPECNFQQWGGRYGACPDDDDDDDDDDDRDRNEDDDRHYLSRNDSNVLSTLVTPV